MVKTRKFLNTRIAPIEPTLDEQLVELLKNNNAKEYTLEMNKDGTLLIDKNLHPDLYDWAVNG